MRWVLDTNVVIAGLLWTGHPNRLLELAIDGKVTLYSSPTLIDELAQTLRHSKFSRRIEQCGTTPSTLAVHYSALVTMMSPTQVPRVVEDDADDDHVLACALACEAKLIVSGDRHLLTLGGQYQGIPIVTPAQAIRVIDI
jgi:putative PIN family toxin of toxin-antitoxin system